MVDDPSALSPAPSESRPIRVSVDNSDTPAIRSASLSAPANTPHDPNGRSLSTSAASLTTPTRPSTSRSWRNKIQAGLAPSTPTGDDSRSLRSEDIRPATSGGPSSLRSVPSIIVNESGLRPSSRPGSRPGSRWSERKWGGLKKRSGEFERKLSSEELPPVPRIEPAFSGISMDIPTGSLDGLGKTMKFSTRGSLIKDRAHRPKLKEKPNRSLQPSEMNPDQLSLQQSIQEEPEMLQSSAPSNGKQDADNHSSKAPPPRPRPQSTLRPRQASLQSRAISADEDMLSRRVRLMYEKGDDNVTDSDVALAMAADNDVLWEEGATPESETASTPAPNLTVVDSAKGRASAEVERIRMKRETQELAGGIEYWQNVDAEEVDRYGFIHPTPNGSGGSEPHPIQRVTTSLLLASETPRRKRSIRPQTGLASNRSFNGRSPTRNLSQSSAAGRPSSSASTNSASVRRSTSRLRSAANHLPHNRDRKFTDEAADMLTLPVEETDESQDTPSGRAARRKEWEREDKWTKMAKPTKKNKDGGGMTFEFDTHSAKLVERTWKGIPDRWRATAWYSFLEASAKRHKDSPSEEQLTQAFREHQYISSPDDVQIDIDVPRTITSHIMFRRRYRGGQRLLFRVLHAMSLYFPDTGYVQGMAALAATLLAYYDEEHAFVMLARLWQLRGLEQLYKSGFAGLMEALDDFEREWLAGGEVASKLVSQCHRADAETSF